MAISHEDRAWFKKTVEDALVARDEHCKTEIAKALAAHNKNSIFHNPIKAILTGSAFAVGWEALRNIFKHQ